jgi:peptide/nickel transport system substrate-binding protein
MGSLSIPSSWDHNGISIGHDMTIMTAVFDTVLRYNPDGSVAPGIAESWEVSEDRLTITLNIRDGVNFTDGTPVDAEAVAANINRFRESSAVNLAMADHIADVTSEGNVVTVTMSEPDPVIIRNLAGPVGFLMSPASFDAADAATNPVGSGPYILDVAGSTPGHSYTVTPNPDYWGAANLDRFERITMTFFEDVTALNNAILGGQIDAANVWGDQGVVPQFENAGFNTANILLDWFGLLLVDRDGETSPALADVRVRQAINYSLDRAAILDVFNHGRGEVTNQIFGPSTTGFVPAILDRYPFDPARGLELVQEAGFEGATITFMTGGAFDAGMIDSIVQMAADIGLTFELTSAAPGELFNDIQTGRYSIFPMWLSTTDTWQQAQYSVVPTGLFNPFSSEAPEVEAYLHTIQTGSDADAAQAAQDLSRWLVENAWFAPVYYNRATAIFADWVSFVPLEINIMPPIYLISPIS